MARTKMLIDCDPGHDDAIAILYAAKHCDLVGISTTHGNSSLDNVTRNALAVLTLAGLDVPVAKGCAQPLAGSRSLPSGTGLEGTQLPEPDRAPVAQHAVDFLIDSARQHRDELVLAVIGPATNVAMAIKREPRFAGWLREITVMGGSAGAGNITPVAEFNCWCDPEAASVLFGCGAPIRMAGCDVTSRTGAHAADIARLRAGGKVTGHVADLLEFSLARQRHVFGATTAAMHDVCAVVPYVQGDMLTYRPCHVQVEMNGTLTRGMTVCDLRAFTAEGKAMRGGGETNVQLAVDSDAARLVSHVVDTLLTYP
jgi:inosine-uridine nucleoside N-ribohydrolase